MNALTILALIALVIGIGVAYRAGVIRGRREFRDVPPELRRDAERDCDGISATPPSPAPVSAARLPVAADTASAELAQLRAFAEDRHRLFGELADARAETARYRQIVVDIERDAPPPLLDAPGTPDDLKLIVGVGPVIERMLYQMGIATYRQIARWSERDIDAVDARLQEFPGRIRRDGWVTQARALHVSKYGSNP